MLKPRAKYLHLLREPAINRWYHNVARGSRVTADVYLRRLGSFLEGRGITASKLAAMKDKALQDLLMDFVTESEEKGDAGSYIESTVKVIRSWLAHNQRALKVKIKIKGARDTPSLQDERVPTHDELRKIFLASDMKARTCAVLVAHSGLRLETLGNYTGDDGLRVKDLPELSIAEGKVEFQEIPSLVVVRRALSKGGHQYPTFLSEEGCSYLKDYLEERMRQGEKITPDSPVTTPKVASKPFIRAINIGDTIRAAIRRAGYPWRPYVLRSYFDTQLMLAESKGLVLRDYRAFWMGHKGDIEARYTTNKNRLPEEVIEDMRSAYGRAQEHLQTTTPSTSTEEKLREGLRRQLLLVAGFNAEEVEKMNLGAMTDEEFQAKVRERLLGAMMNNGARQRVVPVREVEAYLAQGWEYTATLPNNKAILKLPQ